MLELTAELAGPVLGTQSFYKCLFSFHFFVFFRRKEQSFLYVILASITKKPAGADEVHGDPKINLPNGDRIRVLQVAEPHYPALQRPSPWVS